MLRTLARDVAFAVPETVSGGLMVVVDAVPPPLANIRVGEVVGSVEIIPTATSAKGDEGAKRDAETKPNLKRSELPEAR